MNNKTLGASELVITKEGAIYHLNLRPEEMADTIITVGDPGRVAEVSRHFDKIEHKKAHREFITHTGYVGKKHITVVSTGIGPDNVDIVLNELDALANIDLETRLEKPQKSLTIFRLGTCGALHKDIQVDSMIASSHGIGLDNVLHFYRYNHSPDEAFILDAFMAHTGLTGKSVTPYIAEGSISLRKHFASGFTQGITITCPGFYGPQGRVLRAPVAFPHLNDACNSFSCRGLHITNFEMETSALYGLSKILGHQCLSINTVINNRVLKTFTANMEASVQHMIQTSLAIIENL